MQEVSARVQRIRLHVLPLAFIGVLECANGIVEAAGLDVNMSRHMQRVRNGVDERGIFVGGG